MVGLLAFVGGWLAVWVSSRCSFGWLYGCLPAWLAGFLAGFLAGSWAGFGGLVLVGLWGCLGKDFWQLGGASCGPVWGGGWSVLVLDPNVFGPVNHPSHRHQILPLGSGEPTQPSSPKPFLGTGEPPRKRHQNHALGTGAPPPILTKTTLHAIIVFTFEFIIARDRIVW